MQDGAAIAVDYELLGPGEARPPAPTASSAAAAAAAAHHLKSSVIAISHSNVAPERILVDTLLLARNLQFQMGSGPCMPTSLACRNLTQGLQARQAIAPVLRVQELPEDAPVLLLLPGLTGQWPTAPYQITHLIPAVALSSRFGRLHHLPAICSSSQLEHQNPRGEGQ